MRLYLRSDVVTGVIKPRLGHVTCVIGAVTSFSKTYLVTEVRRVGMLLLDSGRLAATAY